MWYVYCEYVKTDKQEFVGFHDTVEDAIKKMALCYNIDKDLHQLGEYYYFMKRRG